MADIGTAAMEGSADVLNGYLPVKIFLNKKKDMVKNIIRVLCLRRGLPVEQAFLSD